MRLGKFYQVNKTYDIGKEDPAYNIPCTNTAQQNCYNSSRCCRDNFDAFFDVQYYAGTIMTRRTAFMYD